MNAPSGNTLFDVDIEEVEYLRHGGKPYLARIMKPRGKGPFPAVLEAHGGAWCAGDRMNNETVNLPVARGGVVVVSVDYRMPPEGTYPTSVADVHYAIRWLKSKASSLGSRPDLVGAMGSSAGGHLTLLAAMKPDDPRYSSLPLAGGEAFDARVPYIVSLWPALCPLDSYHERRDFEAEHGAPKFGGKIFWEKYWLTEAAMAEGSPVLAMERGDKVLLPRLQYVKNASEPVEARHTTPQALLDRFETAYKKAGGHMEIELFEGPDYDDIRTHPDTKSALETFQKIIAFIYRESGLARP
jgi:hypothetical protein